MNPLRSRLAWLRRQLLLITGVRGLFAVLAFLVLTGLLAGLFDWGVALPSVVRALFLAVILTGAAFLAFRLLLQPLLAPRDDLALALRVEGAFPQLNDSLASTVEFLKQPAGSALAGSEAMRQKAVEQALHQSEGCDFGRILDRRGALAALLAFLVVGAAAGHFAYHYPDNSLTAVKRLADPFGNHTWTRLDMEAPEYIAVGKPFSHRVRIDGIIPENARLQIEGLTRDEEISVARDDDGAYVTVTLPTNDPGPVKFRVLAGDGAFPATPGAWRMLDVVRPPDLASVHVEVEFPAYTGEPTALIYEGDSLPHISKKHFVPGSVVRLRGVADKPLAIAWVQVQPLADGRNTNKEFRAAAAAGVFAAPMGAEALPAAAAATVVYDKHLATITDGRDFFVEFQAWIPGRYVLHLEDEKALDREISRELNLGSDPPPSVILSLVAPDGRPREEMQLDLRPDAELNLMVTAIEKEYALKSLFLQFSPRSGVDEEPLVATLFDEAEVGRLVPALMGAFTLTPPVEGPPLRWQRLERVPVRWPLAGRYKVGETATVHAAAFDSCNIFPDRLPGKSKEIKLRIVSVKELLAKEEKILPDAQINIDKAREILEGALKSLKEVRDKKSADLKHEDIEKVAEAELDQARARAHLEQLLDEMNKLALSRKINKLPSSEASDLLRTLRDEIDGLVQDGLPKIEDELAEAKAKLAGFDKSKGDKSKDEKSKDDTKGKADPAKTNGDDDPLGKAVDLQEKTASTLKDLSRLLDPFASMQLVKDKTRDLLLKHDEIRAATEKLLELQDKIRDKPAGTEKRDAERELKDESARKAAAQASLGEKAGELLKMMAEVAKKRAADKDMENAGKLEKAMDVGTRGKVADKMRDVAADLKKTPAPLNKALQDQDDIKTTLKKIDDILNDKKPTEDVDRLTKRRKKAEDNLDKIDNIRKDLDDLHGKAAKAMEIADPDKKKAALDAIAKEQDRLKKEAEAAARELAKLNEPRAAKALEDVAKELGKGADKARAGDDPGENIEAAMGKLDEADDHLAEVREELAREQIAQITELIKGLKERQDAAIERTVELHKKVMERKVWSPGLIDSLAGDILVQGGLAKEVRAIKEKLKNAIVFEHLMDKAAGSMDRAAEEMTKRKEEARNRQEDMMMKEELADEQRRHDDIKKHQDLASARLNRLLESIKNEKPALKKDAKKKDGEPKKAGKDDGGGGGGAGDAIPPIAQLKALKAEQVDVRERAKEFDVRHPDRAKLTPEAQRELTELQADQVRIQELFEQLTARPEKKGAMP